MKPDWDTLAAENEGSSVVIGDVDCTVHQDICSKYDVKGYPTIKYFTAETGSEGKAYQGGRDLEGLRKFVTDELAAKCSVEDPSTGCDDKEKAFIEKFKAKTPEEQAKELKRLDGMKGSSLKADLKAWLFKRLAILKQLVPAE